jgi:hypothetical protein
MISECEELPDYFCDIEDLIKSLNEFVVYKKYGSVMAESYSSGIEISFTRPETDLEYSARINKEEETARIKDENLKASKDAEYEFYLALKEKYEVGSGE